MKREPTTGAASAMTPRPRTRTIQLLRIAHARSGDKGNTANVGLIALKPEYYPLLVRQVTAARVARHFRGMIEGPVERFELPNLYALNFLLHGALGGGGTISLKTDAQGKVFSTALLRLEIPVPRGWRSGGPAVQPSSRRAAQPSSRPAALPSCHPAHRRLEHLDQPVCLGHPGPLRFEPGAALGALLEVGLEGSELGGGNLPVEQCVQGSFVKMRHAASPHRRLRWPPRGRPRPAGGGRHAVHEVAPRHVTCRARRTPRPSPLR